MGTMAATRNQLLAEVRRQAVEDRAHAPFPNPLRLVLRKMASKATQVVRDLQPPHEAKSTEAYEVAVEDLSTLYREMATLSPAPSSEIKHALLAGSCALRKRADRCRYPKLERVQTRTFQGYYAVLGEVAGALGYAQGLTEEELARLVDEEDFQGNVVTLAGRLKEMLVTAPARRKDSPGAWRAAFDRVIRDVVDLSLMGDRENLLFVRTAFQEHVEPLTERLFDSSSYHDEALQAASWVDAFSIVLNSYAPTTD